MENNREDLFENGRDTMFDDGLAADKPGHAWQTAARLCRRTEKQRGRLAAILISVAFYTAFSLAAPYYSAGIVNLLWESVKAADTLGNAFSVTWRQGGQQIFILLLFYLAAWSFYTLQSYLMLSFAEELSLGFRVELSEKLNRLPLSYYDKHRTGTVLSHFTNDLDKMSEALQTGLLKFAASVCLILGSIVMMLRFNVWLTLIFAAAMSFSMFVTNYFSRKVLKFAGERQRALGNVTGLVEEYYSGRAVIKAFNQEDRSARRIGEANEEAARQTEKTDFMMSAVNPAIRMVNRLGQACVALCAGKLLIEGNLSVGTFQAFFQYVNQSAEPLTEASYVINSMQSALASAERIYALLDEPDMPADPLQPKEIKDARGLIEFRNVRFGYGSGPALMKDISFTASPGQKIAVVGATGAGKTTLINLLMRFYDVSGGKILLDGIDTASMTRKRLRSNFGMVLQDTWLFSGSIAENIAYGKPDAAMSEIFAAAKAARVDFFVRTMPQGYDTQLGNDKENLSAGQRQLLTIARVLLRDPAVLILDEATSSVDTRTEMEIDRAMKSLMKNRTSFVIAHRLSTIADADLILVMHNGNIIEQGAHQELLRAGGAYAELYNSQFA